MDLEFNVILGDDWVVDGQAVNPDLDDTPFEDRGRTAKITFYVGPQFQSTSVTTYLGDRVFAPFTSYPECNGIPDLADVWIEGVGSFKALAITTSLSDTPVVGDDIEWTGVTITIPNLR